MGTNQAFAGSGKKVTSPYITNEDGSTQTPGGTPLTSAPTKTSADTTGASSTGATETAGTGTTEVKDTQAEIDGKLLQAQQDALNANTERGGTLDATYEEKVAEDKAFVEEKEATANEYYDSNTKIIKQANEDISKIEQEQISLYEDRIDRDAVLLQEKADSETALLKAQSEYQRTQNETAIIQARIDVDIQQQQSAWAYNKIGLGYSSGIINQSQQIATNGIIKIAELKAKMNFQEATITAQIADVEYNYANLINSSVDKYTDAIDTLKKDAKARASDVEQSLLKNNFDKKTALEDIAQWAREEKRKTEQEHLDDIAEVEAKGVEYLKGIQATVANINKREVDKLDTAMANGTIMNMLPEEIAKKEAELGLAPGQIESEMNISISKSLSDAFEDLTGNNLMPVNQKLVADVKSEMKNKGLSWDEAVKVVVGREMETNEKLKKAISDKKTSDSALSNSEKINQYKAETDRMKAIETKRKNLAEENNVDDSFYSAGTDAGTAPDGTALKRYATASDEIVTTKGVGTSKELSVNSVAMPSLQGALELLGDGIMIADSYRSYDEQKALYDQFLIDGKGQVAKPGESMHQSGMSIDIVADANFTPLNEEQVKIMNDKGWFQNAGPNDPGHFEYLGTKRESDAKSKAISDEYESLFGKTIPDDMSKEGVRGAILNKKIKEDKLDEADIAGIVSKDTIKDIDAKDDKRNKQGFKDFFNKMRDKGIGDEQIIEYLRNNGAITGAKGEGEDGASNWLANLDFGDRGLYLGDDGHIYRADAFGDTLIYKIN